MPKLSFVPSLHGFHFNNNFTEQVLFWQVGGLCGGMSLAVFNYFRHGMPIPTHKQGVGDFGTTDDLPPPHSRLRNYIYDMQLNSFVTAFGFAYGGGYQDMVNEFNRVRTAIDKGQFLLLGLRMAPGQQGLGHQVLAYGYDAGAPYPRIYIYDPNFPDQDIALGIDQGHPYVRHVYSNLNAADTRYASYFVQTELGPNVTDALTEAHRPTYLDLGLQKGIELSTPLGGEGLRQMGERLEVQATVHNYGEFPAHMECLLLWARDPQGNNLDQALGKRVDVKTIKPGESREVRQVLEHFGDRAGSYTFGMAYKSVQGHWIQIPPVAGGARNKVVVNVADQASSPQRWYRVTTSLSQVPAIGVNQDGRLELFARKRDGSMCYLFQDKKNYSLDWSLGRLPGESGVIGGSPAVVQSNDGRLEVFARGRNGQLWHCWQKSKNAKADSDWESWVARGGELISDPAAGRNKDGRLEVFAVFKNQMMHKIFQTTVGSWFLSGFGSMPAPVLFVGNPSAWSDQKGRLVVAARGKDNAIWICQQQTANGPYLPWHSLGGTLTSDPVLGCDQDGRLEVFALGADNRMRHCWQNVALEWTGNWRVLDDHLPVGERQTAAAGARCAACLNKKDGCLVVAVTVAGNRVKTIAQKNPNGGWGGWRDHGGPVDSTVAIGCNPNGVVEIFGRDPANQLQHTWFPE